MSLLSYLYRKSIEFTALPYNFLIPATAETEEQPEAIDEPSIQMGLSERIYYYLSHLDSNIESDEKEISSDWQRMLMDNNALKKLNFSNLESRIAIFLQTYQTEKDSEAYQRVHQIGQRILTSPSIIFKELNGDRVVILEDGHCLFDAFAYAYYHLDGPTKEICTPDQLPREYLRQKVAEYEEEKYEKDALLKDLVNEAIIEIKENTIEQYEDAIYAHDFDHAYADKAEKLKNQKEEYENLSDKELCKHYFQDLKAMPQKRPLWGGQAELYSLSQIFEVTVHLEQPIYHLHFNEGQEQSITLERVNGNHFNAKLKA